MNRIPLVAAASLLALALAWPAAPPTAAAPVVTPPDAAAMAGAGGPAAPAFAPGRVLVRFRSAARAAQRASALAAVRATTVADYPFAGVTLLALEGVGVEEAVARLAADPQVAYAEPDWRVSVARAPDDPLYAEQWALANRGQTQGTPGADINAEPAWDLTTGDPAVVVGVLDTGVDLAHPDLAGNLWINPGEIPANGIDDDGNGYRDDVHGWDFANGDPDPSDDVGHGTHVAGTIAAAGNNAYGVAGVCWRAKIMALKFLDANGSGFTSGAIGALEYAASKGVRITNNSWGGGPYSQALSDALAAAGAAGMLVVAAAGNFGIDNDVLPFYPASYATPEIVSVAATDKLDARASFSNYGATTVDLAAPGALVLSLWPGRRFALLSGTSMASPHVAGAAALLLARDPRLSPAALKDRLLRGALPLPSLAGDCVTGGRLDLVRTLADPDTVPPGALEGIAVAAAGSNDLELAWTATGDDGGTGQALRYDVRVSTSPFDEAGFASAPRAFVAPPGPAGVAERVKIRGLSPLTTYWLAARAEDEFGNAGAVSAVVTGTTLEPPRLVLSASALAASLRTGESAEHEVTITNDSQGTLDWSVPQASLAGPEPETALRAPPPPPAPGLPGKGADGARQPSQSYSSGGPDAFGYRWIDSGAPGGPVYEWIDIERPEHRLELSGDDALSDAVALGFEFPFYGATFDRVRVCTNGFLTFEEGDAAYANLALPSGLAPGRMVAPLWDDLSFGFAVRRAYAWSDGARFVVTWSAVPRWGDALSSLTFQVVLEPGGGMRFQYRSLAGDLGSCTVGLQDGSRRVGLTVADHQGYLRDGLAVRIVPMPRWVSSVPDSGSLGPGGSAVLRVRFDAARLGGGRLATTLHVRTNDPDAPDAALPASLEVSAIPIARLHTPALAFGPVQAGRSDTLQVLVENAGGAPLALAGAQAPPPFAAELSPRTLQPGEFTAVRVAYAPERPGADAGVLAIATDDGARPLLEVPLAGEAVPPPELAVDTGGLRLAAANGLGERALERTATVLVRNDGDSPLHWRASAVQGPTAPGAARAPAGAGKGVAGPLGAVGTGEPDAAGYRWTTSEQAGGLPFEWEEVAEVGARLFGGADDSTRTAVPLPFAFPFYGDTFTTVNVCTNGWLSFSDATAAFLNADLPDTSAGSPRHLVAPWWDDLDLRPVGGPSGVFAWYDGAKFVVEWRDAARFAGGGPYTFEVMLWPDGAIDFQYLSMAGGTDQATVGLQNGDATVGLRVAWNTPWVHDRLRVRLAQRPAWLAVDRGAGVTPAGGVDTLRVRVTAEGRGDGDLEGAIRIASDDPARPEVDVPVALHVGAAGAAAELRPARLGPVSHAPLVELVVTRPAGHAGFVPGSLELAGARARADLGIGLEGDREVARFDAVTLRAGLAAGAGVRLPFSGEMAGGWVADSVVADVAIGSFAAGPLPAFGAPDAWPTVRAGTTLPLEWTAPEGSERVEVMHSSDGGRSWTRLASTGEPSWPFVPADGSAANLVELVAFRGDSVLASWLSRPFEVVRRDLPQVGPEVPPAAFALRSLSASPGRLPARLLWSLPAASRGRVTVHDVRGARVRTLFDGALEAGTHALEWDGRDGHGAASAPGVYFVRAEAAGRRLTRRLVVLR